jgi:hypothetical protein
MSSAEKPRFHLRFGFDAALVGAVLIGAGSVGGGFFGTTLMASGAQAQELKNWCEVEARQMCGDPMRNLRLADCLNDHDLWPAVPNECIGDLQTMVEMEREANAETNSVGISGFSYGGILREGPGTEFRRMGSLVEGEYLEVLNETGIWWDGYQWFRVSTPIGTGYHWGGIFCTESAPVAGVLGVC